MPTHGGERPEQAHSPGEFAPSSRESGHRYRWVILSVGVLAQAALAALQHGLPALGPILRTRFDLTLPEIGLVLASSNWGIMSTLLLWGALADRWGERLVIAAGLGGSAVAIIAASQAADVTELVLWLILAGALGSAASAASGRAVMHWFSRRERGFALGIRQMAIPLGSAVAALSLPLIAAAAGLDAALFALAGAAGLGAVCAALLLSSSPGASGEISLVVPLSPLRDGVLWRLAFCSGLLVCSQVAMNGFVVLLLNEYRGIALGPAALVLAAINLGGGAARVLVGRLSDRSGRRLPPIRKQALWLASALMASALLIDAPLPLLIPALVAAGVFALSWNGLAMTAAAEMAGQARAGLAIGLQGTVIRVVSAGAGVAFGFAVEQTGSWALAILLLGLLPLISYSLMAPLSGEEERRLLPLDPARPATSPPA
ncbi:MFS transporter [Microvirga lenta]|uniref:MFS transporter n=1 Tax=Microvirga lenta TaxID=2881337 RepID=UPI001CFCFB77|nr:MFS transporter [Microvirga lenta]MCB5174219.1 MFS transporter [Microvirga lenta]